MVRPAEVRTRQACGPGKAHGSPAGPRPGEQPPMHSAPVPKRIFTALLAAAALAVAMPAAPASAMVCPSGVSGVYYVVYCVASGGHYFQQFTESWLPTLYYRMNDAAGSSIMASDPGTYYPLTNPIDGEYKNGQDSGPIGVADDGDRARQFFGSTGYAYINGVSAPNWHGSQPYGNYTMEAWIYRSDHGDGTIMEFGRAGSVYISGDSVYFQNGDDVTTSGIPVNINQWYMVIAEKSANHLYLFVQASPSTPTACNPTQVSGSSLYRPEGAPTFYVGYGNQSGVGWFNGAIDEVVYFTRALTQFEYCAQYYADPVPDGSTMPAPPPPVPSPAGNTGGGDQASPPPAVTPHKPA